MLQNVENVFNCYGPSNIFLFIVVKFISYWKTPVQEAAISYLNTLESVCCKLVFMLSQYSRFVEFTVNPSSWTFFLDTGRELVVTETEKFEENVDVNVPLKRLKLLWVENDLSDIQLPFYLLMSRQVWRHELLV